MSTKLRLLQKPDPAINHRWNDDFLDEGLKVCSVCGCGEAELLATCPGVPMSSKETEIAASIYFFIRPGEDSCHAGTIDEYNAWVKAINKARATHVRGTKPV